jgi:protein transport protein SEC31
MPVYEVLANEMQRIKSKAPAAYKVQVLDTEKRLSVLFDLLNNQDPVIRPATVEQLKTLAQAVQERQHDAAQSTLTEIMTTRSEEGSAWMVCLVSFFFSLLVTVW